MPRPPPRPRPNPPTESDSAGPTASWPAPRWAPWSRPIIIFIFFLVVAPAFRSPESFFTTLYQSSTIGIVAVGVGMLMIGGEFDLSAGVITTTAGLANSMFCWYFGVNLWVGAILSLIFCLAIGFLNGYLVMRTGIPSFLITLGTFFVLQGANLGITKLVTGSVSSTDISQIQGYDSLGKIFASSFKIGPVTIWGTVDLVDPVRGARRVDPDSAPGSATGCTRSAGTSDSARAVGVPVLKYENRVVHDRVVLRLVHRHAHALPLQHAAGR